MDYTKYHCCEEGIEDSEGRRSGRQFSIAILKIITLIRNILFGISSFNFRGTHYIALNSQFNSVLLSLSPVQERPGGQIASPN